MSDQPENLTLDDILLTSELSRRSPSPPNWQAEVRAMQTLAAQMAINSETLLQSLVDVALELCQAGSAGVSLLETTPEGEEVFRWNVLAGQLAEYVGGTSPRNCSPCGVCLERGEPQLYSHPERYFTYLQTAKISTVEVLLLPLIVENEALGTIWIVSHQEGQQFNPEDVRVMTGLANFTATALQNQRRTQELLAANARLELEVAERQRAEKSAREMEGYFRAIADLVPDLLWRNDLTGDTSWYNRRWLNYTGQTLEEAQGYGWLDVIHPDDRAQSLANFQNAVNQGYSLRQEHRIRGADGRYRWFLVRAEPQRDERGQIMCWFGAATDIDDRKQAELALRDREALLAAELANTKLLQQISSKLITEDRIEVLYEQIIEAATALMGSDMASLQILDPERNQLRLLAWKGLDPASAAFWEWVSLNSSSTCGVALYTGERILVSDVETWDLIAGTEDLNYYSLSGIRAVQSTPLISRSGRFVGMISTHWRSPYKPSEREFALLDLLARQTADLIERKQAEDQLRASEEKYRTLFNSIDEGFCIIEMLFDDNSKPIDYRFLEINPSFEQQTGLVNAEGKRMRQLAPKHEEHWFEIYGRVALTGESTRFENRAEQLGRWFDVYAFRWGEPADGLVAVLFKDITDRKQVEREREQFLAVGSDLQAITNTNGYFQWVSPTFERILGLTVEEMTSRPWVEFVHPDDIAQSVSETESLFSGRETVAFENRYRHKDGSYRWFLWNARLSPSEQILYGAAVDITERKQAEAALRQSEDRLRMAINSAKLGTWDWNLITNQLIWDANCKAMFGLSEEAEINIDVFFQALHPDDRDRLEKVVQESLNFAHGGNYDVEFRTIGISDGIERWIAAKGQVYFDGAGNAQRFIGTVLDITARKQAELERDRLLEREQAARAEAERANRIKDEFLAVLSHELRTPLNPILGWTKMLQTRKLNPTKMAEALAVIERNVMLQTQLINDLLDLAKILRGKLSLDATPVDLSAVMEAALETVKTAATAKSISLHPILPDIGWVFGDAARLQQIVWNLLSNAIKFTPEGGRIDISLEKDGKQAKITVKDTGRGVTPDFLPHIFESFRQENSSIARSHGGLGLGLAIVRQLVEAHGGTITAESRGVGFGATFTVRLPLLDRTAQAEATDFSSQSSLDLTGIRVLAVDDHRDTCQLIAALLTGYGASVVTLTSAMEVSATLESFQPQVLLSDIGMPEVDGFTLLQQIRSLPPEKGGQTPAIALTAYAKVEDRRRALASGFQEYLTKPLDFEQLVEAVVRLVKKE
ncbi:PAS domain S-box protein [Capilliphycus salinus ALCB114379]|uniref:PAS domain S-box protein n=1 Tax=Capilliphycus salinus TaxID=2768948 RepID=UPI0039A696DA